MAGARTPRRLASGLGVVIMMVLSSQLTADVRRPAVAGSFYPGDAATLAHDVRAYLETGTKGTAPAAIIAPHAGYVFSGATAGTAFAGLAGAEVHRVILLGPSHRAAFSGAALPSRTVRAFATPLGELPVDSDAVEALRRVDGFEGPAAAHEGEHCLEVQLPFIQETLGTPSIVPILIGHATDRDTVVRLARALQPYVDERTVVVVSSDFTHHGGAYGYAPFPENPTLGPRLLRLTEATAGRAAAVDPDGFWYQVETSRDTVCGARPIAVLLELLAHAFDGSGTVTGVTTSGDVSGDWHQTVAYAAVAFTGRWTGWREPAPPAEIRDLDADEQQAALALARATLATYLGHGEQLATWFAAHPDRGVLESRAGLFVTVNNTPAAAARHGRLRGCIGVMEAREPLLDGIVHTAVSAAHDPRFPPLAERELATVELELSILSPMHPVPGAEAVEVGRHGVLLTKRGHRAVFLPQVATEYGWDRETMLTQLSLKAGLAPDDWRRGATFEVFTAQVFGEGAH